MIRKILIAAFLTASVTLPALAQTSGTQGERGRTTDTTSSQATPGGSTFTGNQRYGRPGMPFAGDRVAPRRAGLGIGTRFGLAPVFGGAERNGLPPCNMDSFVYEAMGHREHIYGDEGVYSIPPYFEFTPIHRIERGILGRRNAGLSTGHGSSLPPAWGGDEFVDTEPFTMAGKPMPFKMVPPEAFLADPLPVTYYGGTTFGFNLPFGVNGNTNGGGNIGIGGVGLGNGGMGGVGLPGGLPFNWP
ncbi:MAG TPA: hypothetical protein V6D17_15915 [Candidatus Obscuribacterales bacterium]